MKDHLYRLAADYLLDADVKAERMTLRQRVGIGLGVVCLVLLGIFATNAHAAPVFKTPEGSNGQPVSLRLLDTPCTDEKVLRHIVANVQPQFLSLFKSSVLHWGGKDYASCWLEYEGNVYSFDEEGAPFNPPAGVPRRLFREDSV